MFLWLAATRERSALFILRSASASRQTISLASYLHRLVSRRKQVLVMP